MTNRIKTTLGIIILGVSLSQNSFAEAYGKLPVPEIEALPNGLKLAWFINDNLPVIDLALLIQSGYRDDPSGKSGTSELLSSCLDRGAAGMSAQQIAHSVEMLGASRYASTEDDTSSVGMHGLAPDGNLLLDLLSKLVIHPDFPEAEVSREHARLIDRWNHIDDYGETLAALAYHRAIAANTSYGRGSFLSVDEFKKVTRKDVMDFHKKHFVPSNSILMIVGRVNKPEFRQRILESFGKWSGAAPERIWKNYTDKRTASIKKNQIIIVNRSGLTQAQVRLGFRAPLLQAPEHYSLVVANALLGEYFNSRLNSLIRDKLALTYSIGSSFSYSKDLGVFTITSATRNETVGQLIHKTMDVLQDLKRGPIGPDEVQMAKDYLEGGFPLSTSTLGAVASRWLAGYVFGLGPEYLNEFILKIHQVKAEEVFAAVVKDFNLDHLFIVIAGDAKEISKSLKKTNYSQFKLVSVKQLK